MFRFKQFEVHHGKSSMKVGVDGVLAGAWGSVVGEHGLDIGCGCGVIALMCVQRNPSCLVTAIDIDGPSAEEAAFNFSNSPWLSRLKAERQDAAAEGFLMENKGLYDFIVSNPPFFNSGVRNPETSREKARHQGTLSPEMLVSLSSTLLKESGTLTMIIPAEQIEDLTRTALKKTSGLSMEKVCLIADRPGKMPKRALVLLRKERESVLETTVLYIRNEDGEYSDEYKALTRDFYLKF